MGDGTSLVVGLRVRAVRAGSIGREKPESAEQAESPERGREALAPAPATEMPPPHGSKRNVRTRRPGHGLAFRSDSNPEQVPTRDRMVTVKKTNFSPAR